MGTVEKLHHNGCSFVNVLTTQSTGAIFGYRLQGAAAGPQLVVAGTCSNAVAAFDRILRIPTLPWMKGTLVLIQLDKLADIDADLSALPNLGAIDRTLILPWDQNGGALAVRRSCNQVLRACTDLGMIRGRGVSFREETK